MFDKLFDRFDKLFGRVGYQIKTTAVWFFVLGLIASLLTGIIYIINAIFSKSSNDYNNNMVIGVVVILGGLFLSVLLSLIIYGFGELIENSEIASYNLEKIANHLMKKEDSENTPSSFSNSQINIEKAPENENASYADKLGKIDYVMKHID